VVEEDDDDQLQQIQDADGWVVRIHTHAMEVVAVVEDQQHQDLLREYHHLRCLRLEQTCSILDVGGMLRRWEDCRRRHYQILQDGASTCGACQRQMRWKASVPLQDENDGDDDDWQGSTW
jgi:hypothetical protein